MFFFGDHIFKPMSLNQYFHLAVELISTSTAWGEKLKCATVGSCQKSSSRGRSGDLIDGTFVRFIEGDSNLLRHVIFMGF